MLKRCAMHIDDDDDDEFICDQVNDPRWYKKKKKTKNWALRFMVQYLKWLTKSCMVIMCFFATMNA